MKDGFEGVWLPRDLCLDRKLSWTEKVLLNELHNLSISNPARGCWAGNGHFAELLNVTAGRSANMISDLRKRGYIGQVSFDGKNRSLRISSNMLHLFVKHNPRNLHENVSEPSRKRDPEPSRKREHNNTSLNKSLEETISAVAETLPHQSLFEHHHKRIGKITDGAAQGKTIKAILASYSVDDAIGCYEYQVSELTENGGWRDSVSWVTVYGRSKLSEWITKGKPSSSAKHGQQTKHAPPRDDDMLSPGYQWSTNG